MKYNPVLTVKDFRTPPDKNRLGQGFSFGARELSYQPHSAAAMMRGIDDVHHAMMAQKVTLQALHRWVAIDCRTQYVIPVDEGKSRIIIRNAAKASKDDHSGLLISTLEGFTEISGEIFDKPEFQALIPIWNKLMLAFSAVSFMLMNILSVNERFDPGDKNKRVLLRTMYHELLAGLENNDWLFKFD